MAFAAQFVAVPRIGQARISTANPNRNGTGTVASLFVASVTNGSRVDSVSIKALGDTLSGVIRFFVHDGTNYRLLSEQVVDEISPAADEASFGAYIELAGGIPLPAGWSLCVSTEVANTFDVLAFGGDF